MVRLRQELLSLIINPNCLTYKFIIMIGLKKFRDFLFGKKKERKLQQSSQPTPETKLPKSTKPCIYSGPGGSWRLEKYEPAFRNPGVIIPLAVPQPVSFPLSEKDIDKLRAGLRYVWCDGFEAAEWQPRDCKYLGIRITDSFVLHETVMFEWSEWLRQWEAKCHARRLTVDELLLFVAVWPEINAMRVMAEDLPVPNENRFWVKGYDCLADRQGNFHLRASEEFAVLLMAVTNY